MNKHYALLCDYGLDDAVATVALIDARDRGDLVDVIPVGGNSEVSVSSVTRRRCFPLITKIYQAFA